jgi:hypothetical protein
MQAFSQAEKHKSKQKFRALKYQTTFAHQTDVLSIIRFVN